jgi:hypothetical protein
MFLDRVRLELLIRCVKMNHMTAVRKSVFGSETERRIFGHLVRKWSERLNVYHNLPFLQIFDLNKIIGIMSLGEVETSRLKKTSIDFVFCDKEDRPLVAIDFDGLNEGFSNGSAYIDDQNSKAWRKLIFNLKLSVAHWFDFPYVIVRSAQFKLIPSEAKVTVVDGVIGSVLAKLKAREKWAKIDVVKEIPALEKMTKTERSEAVQDLLIQVETAQQFENCPITARRWALFKEIGVTKYGHFPLEYSNSRGVEAYVCVGEQKTFARVWIPAFGVSGICELGLLENLGYLVAAEKLKRSRDVN